MASICIVVRAFGVVAPILAGRYALVGQRHDGEADGQRVPRKAAVHAFGGALRQRLPVCPLPADDLHPACEQRARAHIEAAKFNLQAVALRRDAPHQQPLRGGQRRGARLRLARQPCLAQPLLLQNRPRVFAVADVQAGREAQRLHHLLPYLLRQRVVAPFKRADRQHGTTRLTDGN
jgi:hypothetical protein